MSQENNVITTGREKLLFTPGPLGTSLKVKTAMLRDLGSRDKEFIEIVKEIRKGLLDIAQVSSEEYTAIPLQGSGSYALEAVVSSCVPRSGKLLCIINGSYGKRLALMAETLGIETVKFIYPESSLPDISDIEKAVKNDPDIRMISMCSCETTSGIFNPVKEIGVIAKRYRRDYFLDAMSNFGAADIPVKDYGITYLVSSANKCIEGVPGFSFIIAERKALAETEGNARSVSFDLFAQNEGLDNNGQFRFTPPTHSILAFHQALKELEEEGGVKARSERYLSNYRILVQGMRKLGFREYLDERLQGYIITSFYYPKNDNWDFNRFYSLLNDWGFVIYPGKVGDADCFRIGNIGKIYSNDILNLISAIGRALSVMEITEIK